jgi:hypothetical protein
LRITYWTDDDVKREAELRKVLATVQPDFVIGAFSDLLNLMRIA